MVSGDFRLSPKDDFLYSFYEGDALGPYAIGFQSVVFNDTTRTVTPFRSLGWVAGYQHIWSRMCRSNISVGGVSYKTPNLSTAQMAYFYLKSGLSAFANTVFYFDKNVDLGIEYGIEQARAAGTYHTVDSNDQPSSRNTNAKVKAFIRAKF
jgi:hypothetical protein